MTLHLLIVEDEDDFVEELSEIVDELPVDTSFRIARSRDEAYEQLEKYFSDLVILDLTIPTVSGALDADPEHGYAVFGRTRKIAPGAPIFVLTGSPAENFVPNLLEHQQQIDIWSEGKKTGTIGFLTKLHIDKFPRILSQIAEAIDRLSDVELESEGLTLSVAEDRLIRIFAKKYSGVRCSTSELRSGQSGARVIRLRVTDHRGVLVHDAVAKLSNHADIRKEDENYDLHVTRLASSATPRKLATLEYGADWLSGIFFGLAEGSDESTFDIASNSPESAKDIICSIEAAMAPWIEGVPETRVQIRQIRQRLLNDDTFHQIRETFRLGWVQSYENREIQARLGCSHGDLHGKNIVISPTGAQLIDYGDVGDGPASLDPVTLELSLLFHPHAPERPSKWPTTEQANAWGDLDFYLRGCPFCKFVRECRAWALRAAAGNREVAASAYGYLVRQLKYEDTDKDLACALLEGVRSFYQEST